MERGFFAFVVVLVILSSLVTINGTMIEKTKHLNHEIVEESIANHNYWLKVNIEQLYNQAIAIGVDKSKSKTERSLIKQSIAETMCNMISGIEENENAEFYLNPLPGGVETIRKTPSKKLINCNTEIEGIFDSTTITDPETQTHVVTIFITGGELQNTLYSKIGNEFAVLTLRKWGECICASEAKCLCSTA